MQLTQLTGIQGTLERIEKQSQLYDEIVESRCDGTLAKTPFHDRAIELFGPCLSKGQVDLKTIFDAAFHRASGSLLVATRGVTYLARAPKSASPYITRHIACAVYHPAVGVESVNVGLVGDVYEGDVILRAESACPPAFLFGTQRCNCADQWASVRELCAHFNPILPPQNLSAEAFEQWVQKQCVRQGDRHVPLQSGQGLVLIHLDSQAGMGSGYTEGEFTYDLTSRALLRQMGENTVEEVYHTSIKQGYEALGLPPDARKECREAGYRIPSIVLQWLGVSRRLIVLSNNRSKLKQLEAHGFAVKRVKSLGQIAEAGRKEARQRGEDFAHLDITGEELCFEQEIERLKIEIPRPVARVNRTQCQAVGALLSRITLKKSAYDRPFITVATDPEYKLAAYLFSIGICHQTHVLIHRARGLHGWDYLEAVFTELAQTRSPLLDPFHIASLSLNQIAREYAALFEEQGETRLDRLKERAELLQGISQVLVSQYDGKPSRLLTSDAKTLYQRLAACKAYSDPFCKKSSLFILLAIPAGLLTIDDPENIVPIMDYHMQRVLLRLGCVEILDPALKRALLAQEPLASDAPVRAAAIEAIRQLSHFSGHPHTALHDVFWPLGRSCCKEKPLCKHHTCDKSPCTLDHFVGPHIQCLLESACKGRRDDELIRLWQPIVDTHYY